MLGEPCSWDPQAAGMVRPSLQHPLLEPVGIDAHRTPVLSTLDKPSLHFPGSLLQICFLSLPDAPELPCQPLRLFRRKEGGQLSTLPLSQWTTRGSSLILSAVLAKKSPPLPSCLNLMPFYFSPQQPILNFPSEVPLSGPFFLLYSPTLTQALWTSAMAPSRS